MVTLIKLPTKCWMLELEVKLTRSVPPGPGEHLFGLESNLTITGGHVDCRECCLITFLLKLGVLHSLITMWWSFPSGSCKLSCNTCKLAPRTTCKLVPRTTCSVHTLTSFCTWVSQQQKIDFCTSVRIAVFTLEFWVIFYISSISDNWFRLSVR